MVVNGGISLGQITLPIAAFFFLVTIISYVKILYNDYKKKETNKNLRKILLVSEILTVVFFLITITLGVG
ncbi:hypothetical protein H0N95_01650 [Candidatus Micrarchaeota archaeon]|nr:hypothetical protein [Candidatus Micrarchaeota archaeon]